MSEFLNGQWFKQTLTAVASYDLEPIEDFSERSLTPLYLPQQDILQVHRSRDYKADHCCRVSMFDLEPIPANGILLWTILAMGCAKHKSIFLDLVFSRPIGEGKTDRHKQLGMVEKSQRLPSSQAENRCSPPNHRRRQFQSRCRPKKLLEEHEFPHQWISPYHLKMVGCLALKPLQQAIRYHR